MIIGRGDIASVLPKKKNLLFFASGVSNSQEMRESEYEREIELLFDQPISEHIVYFSSLSIFYSKGRYAKHKLRMEELIKNTFWHYTIIRLGNITWGDNPHTLINFMRNQVRDGKKVEIRDEYRYIVDKEEFLHWINMIPDFNCEINIPGRMMSINEIFGKFIAHAFK